MARFAIVSGFGCGLSIWKRLADEGHEVRVWIKEKTVKDVGNGIVEKAGTLLELIAWARGGDSVFVFDSSGDGEDAEIVRRTGIPVVGGCSFADRLEKDRTFGFKIAEEAGMLIPPHEQFASFDEAIEFAREMEDTPVYFKSDRYLDADATHGSKSTEELVEYLEYVIRTYGGHGKCILQQKIEGTPLSTARWWNGVSWVGPYQATLEHKKFCDGEIGPSTGCSFNAVWFYQEENPRIAQELRWEELTQVFRKYGAAPGLYDVNAVVTADGEVYFLEWTPRFGYDSEPTSFRLYEDAGELLRAVALGGQFPEPSREIGYAIRLSVPPYPWEHSKKIDTKSCMGTYVSGEVGDLWSGDFIAYQLCQKEYGYEVASPEGIVGLSYTQGHRLGQLNEAAIEGAKAIRAPGLQYRTDGAKTIAKDAKALQEAGFEIHSGLLR